MIRLMKKKEKLSVSIDNDQSVCRAAICYSRPS